MTPDRTHRLPKRIALGLLQWYPRSWRNRYLAEMSALLEEMPVGWAQAANVAATAVREWLSPRALGWPARTAAGSVLTFRAVVFVGIAFALDALARLAAVRMHASGIEMSSVLEDVASVCFLVASLRLFPAMAFNVERTRSRHWMSALKRWRRPLGPASILMCAALLLPWMFEHYFNGPESYLRPGMRTLRPYMHVLQVWLYASILHTASRRTWRLKRVEYSSWRPFSRA
jgi:hypothetical protein